MRVARLLHRIRDVRLVFDRGTILVLEPPASFDAAQLPGTLWDPRVGAHRAPARHLPEMKRILLAAGVPFSVTLSGSRPAAPRFDDVELELRPYQQAALAAWDLADRRGLVVLPTGAGKTRLAIAAIIAARTPAICLVPTCVLLEQWAGAIEMLTGVRPGLLGDGSHQVTPLTVATFESAWRWMDRLGDRYGLLVVDEAHHFGCGLRDEALGMCAAPFRLGLTATAPEGAAALRLEELMGPKVYALSAADLAGEYLAPWDTVVVHVDLDAHEREEYRSLMQTFGQMADSYRRLHPAATWEDLATAASKTDEGRRAMAAWRRGCKLLAYPQAKRRALSRLLREHAGRRVLVFVGDNDTAYDVAREHLIMPITCDIGRRERDDALRGFRDGRLRALVSSQVLNEGLDVPDAEVGIVVSGRHGQREHVQRVGRLLRPCEGKRALIYELVVRRTREVRDSARRQRALAA